MNEAANLVEAMSRKVGLLPKFQASTNNEIDFIDELEEIITDKILEVEIPKEYDLFQSDLFNALSGFESKK